MLKNILLICLLFFSVNIVYAQNIDINSFDELINSTPKSGDTLIFTRDLEASSSIGNHLGY